VTGVWNLRLFYLFELNFIALFFEFFTFSAFEAFVTVYVAFTFYCFQHCKRLCKFSNPPPLEEPFPAARRVPASLGAARSATGSAAGLFFLVSAKWYGM
jgi:hypothetical protein